MIRLSPILTVPFARSYWIVPGQFLAGCYPGFRDKKEATENSEVFSIMGSAT